MLLVRKIAVMTLFTCGILMARAGTALGQIQRPGFLSTTETHFGARTDASSGEQFPQGTSTLQFEGAYLHSFDAPRLEEFAGGRFGGSYYFKDRLAISADVPVYWARQKNPGIAAGFDLLVRWHWFERDHLSLYLDGGAGFLLADRNVPPRGTHFNFTPQVGIGVTYLLDDRTYLYCGTRFWHLSNAGIWGSNRNPSIDKSFMGYVGMGWRF